MEKIHYIYKGPVMGLSRTISEKWEGETHAISKRKAIANLGYQFKKQYGLAKTSKVSLSIGLLKEEEICLGRINNSY